MVDIKADNFLANLSTGKSKVGDIKLGDPGDSVPENVHTNDGNEEYA